MRPGAGPARVLVLAAAVSAAAAAGCSLFSSGGTAGSGGDAGIRTGQVVLTARGAMAVMRGDTASLSRAVEDMFENLEIYLVGETMREGAKQLRGRAGTSEIFVELEPQSGRNMQVNVRVRETGLEDSHGRWDRLAARGLVEEIRRWAAQ